MDAHEVDVALEDLIRLRMTGEDVFEGQGGRANAYGVVYGGLLAAQALFAADATTTDREVHSLHGRFLKAGRAGTPIIYEVERVHEGSRLSVRRVVARQGGRAIFAMDCSYRAELTGFDHQAGATASTRPDPGIDLSEIARSGRPGLLPVVLSFADPQPVEVRIPSIESLMERGCEPRRHYWLRAPSTAGAQDLSAHRRYLAYMSDLLLAGAALVPHAVPLPGPHVAVSSLDHSIWFHRPVRCDDWLLFETDSPSASNGINLSRAAVHDRTGALVATVMQEALQIPTGN